jgi:hypothetical protein
MIKDAARKVAFDAAISDDELTECCVFLETSIAKARMLEKPIPFADYRNLRIFEEAVRFREGLSSIRER